MDDLVDRWVHEVWKQLGMETAEELRLAIRGKPFIECDLVTRHADRIGRIAFYCRIGPAEFLDMLMLRDARLLEYRNLETYDGDAADLSPNETTFDGDST